MIHRVSGGRREPLCEASKPDGQALREYEVSKLRELGFGPRYGLEEALRETYAWLADNFNSARR